MKCIYGPTMVQLWSNYGLTMVQLWSNYGPTMVRPPQGRLLRLWSTLEKKWPLSEIAPSLDVSRALGLNAVTQISWAQPHLLSSQ